MKKKKDSILIQRFLDGELNADEESRLHQMLEASDELRAEFKQSLKLRELLVESPGEFDSYFSTRVMARLHERVYEDEWMVGLLRIFRRVALTAFLLALSLTAHNVISQWDQRSEKSTMELTLGIPSATIASSLDFLDYWL
jgi:anti-sigma factor RsiW